MLTVGCPTLCRYDLLELMLATASEGDLKPDRYIVVDNGMALGRRWWLDHHKVEVISPGGNIGVAAGWNTILGRSDDHLVIVGDDVKFHKNTLSEMVRTAEASDADFVFPSPNFGGATMFSCFLIKKRLVERIGGFDEVFHPAYYEDNDYHRRMKLAGATEALAPCAYDHAGSATVKALGGDGGAAAANGQRYMWKWGGYPGAESLTVPRPPITGAVSPPTRPEFWKKP